MPICSRVAVPMTKLLQQALEKATHWRIRLVILLVLAVGTVGGRLGLSGETMAFFRGLFMTVAAIRALPAPKPGHHAAAEQASPS